MTRIPLRWVVVGVFMISSALNYLDRQILAALAPAIKLEFGLNNQDYGTILSVFSITYAISSPLVGLFLDRFGLSIGMSLAVGFWSLAGMARGMVGNFTGLLTATSALGIGEAAGIPSTGKVGHLYLLPKERAIGAALSQIGLSVGSVLAPWMAMEISSRYGWRWAFIVPGLLGFLWIPLWLFTERKAVKQEAAFEPPMPLGELLREKQLWGFVVGNIISMMVYSLWTNWTTLFLTTEHHLSMNDANKLAPLPHFFGYFGGLTGGIISYRLVARGWAPLAARRRALLICALMILSTALIPLMPTPTTAALMISFSFFWAAGWGVSYYTMPVDAYGPRAAFAVSLLTMAYGILQIFLSPVIGRTIDRYGFGPVCTVAAFTPLIGYAIVTLTRKRDTSPTPA